MEIIMFRLFFAIARAITAGKTNIIIHVNYSNSIAIVPLTVYTIACIVLLPTITGMLNL